MSGIKKHLSLISPVLVFDAGIGSYDIAERIHHAFPQQDVLYLADREAFPFGSKSTEELLRVISATLEYGKTQYGVNTVVLASNTPSIMILDQLQQQHHDMTITGVFPPIQQALARSRSKHICVLGTDGMCLSEPLTNYIHKMAGDKGVVHAIGASSLIDSLVETGVFVLDKDAALAQVQAFMDEVRKKYPDIDVFTLSSTHLPWLNRADVCPYFEKAAPDCAFIDPAEEVVAHLQLPNNGTGRLKAIATGTDALPVKELQSIFTKMSIPLAIEPVSFRAPPQRTI